MGNSWNDIVDSQLKQAKRQFKSDILSGVVQEQWPDRIDYVAHQVADGGYQIGMKSKNRTTITDGEMFDDAIHDHYLHGIAALTDNRQYRTALPRNFELGQLLVQFAEMLDGMDDVGYDTLDSGEVLARLVTKNLMRTKSGDEAALAGELSTEIQTPRGLITELCSVPEIASAIEAALPDSHGGQSFVDQLANVDLTTELWDHQFEALVNWVRSGYNGYVNMATATGKTVLGLAAVAHCIDAGSLHPEDKRRFEESFSENGTPRLPSSSSTNVLIVTTDELLGVQWARLFQTHCHTPAEFTRIENGSIRLPWGRIEIKSASGIADIDPSEYRLAIFDEVHNYTKTSGWGRGLEAFIESSTPVLALTGSETEGLIRLSNQVTTEFRNVFTYTHEQAISDGVIPDFEWNLLFTDVDRGTSTLSNLESTTTTVEKILDFTPTGLVVSRSALESEFANVPASTLDEIAGEYETGSQFASAIRAVGSADGVGPTPRLEKLASGLSNRSIYRLNLSTVTEPVIELAEEAMQRERPVLILTQSYEQSKEIWQTLRKNNPDCVVKQIDQNHTASEQDRMITSFDAEDTAKKVLIGPGKHIGQGNDIQSVEVGINIARPGSGVNASLVQRLGRLLRGAGVKEEVDFFHVTGVQPATSVTPPDGESFIRNVSEFFAQTQAPDSDGIFKPPTVRIQHHEVGDSIAVLERAGAPLVMARSQRTEVESAYASAIQAREDDGIPTVYSDWFSESFQQSPAPEQPEPPRATESLHAEINPVIYAIIQMDVASQEADLTIEDVVDEALVSFLTEANRADTETLQKALQVTSSHTLSVDCDPLLEFALERRVEQVDGMDTTDDFVQSVILEWLGVDPTENCAVDLTMTSAEIDQLQRLLDRPDTSCTSANDVVQAALEVYYLH